jgi:hypothetical protein|tara:strand:- start:272 stop:634 length:363 start_codon:yes stop_codon:yes gene_type:complete
MSLFATEAAARLTKLLTTYGDTAAIQIKRTTGATKDRVAQTLTGGTPATTNLIGIVSKFNQDTFEGQRVRQTDKRVNVDNAFAPVLTDILMVNSTEHTIVAIKTIDMANEIIGYVLMVRK